MTLFISTYVNKIDKKGRVSIPVAFCATLTHISNFPGFVAFRSYKHATIDCFSYERMVRISDNMDQIDLFSNDQDDFAAAIFADAQQIHFDSEGRIVLSQLLLDHVGLTEQAAFVGRGHTFQIWQPETFRHVQVQARTRMKTDPVTVNILKL